MTHASMVYAASLVDHDKRDAWLSISMHACDSVPMIMLLTSYLTQLLLIAIVSIISKLNINYYANKITVILIQFNILGYRL